MGLNNEEAMSAPIVVDIETVGIPDAAVYLEPVTPDKRLTDPIKIEWDIKVKTAEQLAACSLDWNVGRIAAIGACSEDFGYFVVSCENEDEERLYIKSFWELARYRTIVGFNIKAFDLRFLIRRSQLLGVKYPDLDMGKYTKRGIVDLYQELTFYDGLYDKGAMRRNLKSFCRRFGIPVNDDINGADIPKLIEAGEWDTVLAHVRSDVEITAALAQKLGVIQRIPEAVAL